MVNPRGTTALVALLVTVACDGGPTAPTPVTPVTPVTPTPVVEEVSITVELPYPEDANFNRGISGVTVTCLAGCEGRQVGTTDDMGRVTLTGSTPLTVRAEKSGHLPVERQVSDGSRVLMGNEWPPETKESIRHLAGMADVIASGKLLLIWGDDEYLPAHRHRCVVHLGDPAVQHHHLDGTAHPQCPALLRPIRARTHGRAHPGQDRRVEAERPLDGRPPTRTRA